jgi:hypothetical protein
MKRFDKDAGVVVDIARRIFGNDRVFTNFADAQEAQRLFNEERLQLEELEKQQSLQRRKHISKIAKTLQRGQLRSIMARHHVEKGNERLAYKYARRAVKTMRAALQEARKISHYPELWER